MAARIFYIDESYNDDVFCLTAISIRHTDWKQCFDLIKDHRRALKTKYGISMRKEIHARELVGGRGHLSDTLVGKYDRSQIFAGFLELIKNLPTVLLFNICLPKKGLPDVQMKAWDRMINRIERTMKAFEQLEFPKRRKILSSIEDARIKHGSFLSDEEMKSLDFRLNLFRARALIIADEGRELEITTALRKMHVHNPIPSQFGRWETGRSAKSITTDRIIEDPAFKQSSRSYFLQLADCAAFALLKQEVPPTPNIQKYGIHEMFPVLGPVCYLKASPSDPHGIVRK